MNFSIVKSDKFLTTQWSGGKTTELFIYPPTSNYPARDFGFRISTATVEVEESDFTLLSGFNRNLMILDGAMTLVHKEHHTDQLSKFQVSQFQGDWQTSSVGKCVDFNLMTSAKYLGEVSGKFLKRANEIIELNFKAKSQWQFVWVFKGTIEIPMDSELIKLQQGDLLIIENAATRQNLVKSLERSEIVLISVRPK